MRRRDLPPPEATPPPAESGKTLTGGLFGLLVVGGAVYASRHQRATAQAAAAVVLAGCVAAAGRLWWRGRADPGTAGAVPARRRPPWWLPLALAWVAGLGVAWVALGTAGRVLTCAVTGLSLVLLGWFALRYRQPTNDVNTEPDAEWRAEIAEEWPRAAAAAGLVHPDLLDVAAPLLAPPRPHGLGGTELIVGLRDVLRTPDEVQAALPGMRGRLHAPHLVVEPLGDDRFDAVALRAYRRHPMGLYVPWTALRPLDDPTGEWVPFGLTESARQAVTWWRLSKVIWGGVRRGKSGLIRAFLAGLSAQGIPHRLWFIDNRADFRGLRSIAHRYVGTGAMDALKLLRELAAVMDSRIDSHPGLDVGYELPATLRTPAEILVVGELITAQEGRFPPGTKDVRALRAETAALLRRFPREGRAVAVSAITTAQTPLKEVIGEIRDYFPESWAVHLPDASLVDPALGERAHERGADLPGIPKSLPGVGFMIDDHTGWPLMFRGADIPPADIRAALLDPYRRLMGPRLQVVRGASDDDPTRKATS